jgi:hypothetical protein
MNRGYSADVRLHLTVNGHLFSIGQLGPDFLIVDDPTDHPPAEGEIALWVDGWERRWRVRLLDGIRAGQGPRRIADGA